MIVKGLLRTFIQVVIAVLVLLILLLTGIRLLLTDAFVNLEYRMPYFPEDPYGMTQEERLRYAPIALDYLLNDEDISFLGDLTFEDGTPLYNQRELKHMVDVKILTQQVLMVWYFSLGVFFLMGVWAWFGGWWLDFRKMASSAGLAVVVLVGTLVILLFLSFNQLFTGFHRIFFDGDSWLFRFSDTLIRLFPLRFWQDAFTFVGAFTFLLGLLIWRLLPGRKSTT